MRAEGWYVDPYGAHEKRWFSDGTPTSLVQDGTATSRDDPPDTAPPVPLVEVGPVDSGADDLIRADEQERIAPGPTGIAGSERYAIAGVFASERARERRFRRHK